MSKAIALLYVLFISQFVFGQDDKLSDTVIVQKGRCGDCNVDTLIYTRYKCGLYINQYGEIGLRTHEAIDDVNNQTPNYFYLTTFRDYNYEVKRHPKNMELKDVIDTATFRCLNETYWRDKNHIYAVMGNSDGGHIYLCRIKHSNTFKPLGESRFGINRKNAYYLGSKMKGIDIKSFKLLDPYGNYAYDKNGVYNGYSNLSEEEIKAQDLKQYLGKK